MKDTLTRRNFIRNAMAAAGGMVMIPGLATSCARPVCANDKICIGFIGTGKQSLALFNSFAGIPDVKIAAACDVDQQKLERFKKTVDDYYAEAEGKPGYSACETYERYEDLLDRKGIDAVIIVTPDHWHAIPAIAAIEAGKDVYCEKPLAHTLREGRLMSDAAARHERICQTGSMQRSWGDFRHACELVRNGYLGDIEKILVNVGDPERPYDLTGGPAPDYLNWDRWVGPAPFVKYNEVLSPPITQNHWPRWRDYTEFGGGVIADWGAHMFDIAQWALGMDDSGPVEYIPPEDPEQLRGLKCVYANGVEMTHEDFGLGYAVRFMGTEGTLDVSRNFLNTDPENIASVETGSNDVRLYHSDNHYTDWTGAIKKRTQPVANFEIGHRSASVCNIINIAYKLRRKLEWDPGKEEFIGDSEANDLRTKQYREPYIL